jgi:hypothetical protein
MATELNAIIDDSLFKSTTDGVGAGEYLVTLDNGTFTYTPYIAPSASYGGLIEDGTTVFSMTAATPVALNALGMWAATPSDNITLDAAAGEIAITQDGDYRLSAWVSLTTDTATNLAQVRFKVNGVSSSAALSGTVKDTADNITLSADTFVSLTIGDVVSLELETNKTSSVTVTAAGFTLHKVDV